MSAMYKKTQWRAPKTESKSRRNLEDFSHGDLEKALDREMSYYIRTRYADGMYGSCFTCGSSHPWKQLDAGHYIPRHRRGTRYDERNIRPQCTQCNTFHEGEHWIFRQNLVEQIGIESVEDLEAKARLWGDQRHDRDWLIEQIRHFRALNTKTRKSYH